MATSLEKDGSNDVKLLDLCFSPDCEADIRKTIRSFLPDIIGISIRNIDDTGGYNVHFLLKDVKDDVIDHCKREFNGPIVVGGPSVGISGPEMLEYFDLEFAIRGDGEAVMPEFVKLIESGKTPEGLEGLIIRRGNAIISNNEPYRIKDLNILPFVNPLRFLDLDKYRRFGSPLHIQTKRGCAFNCSYCTYNKIEGKQYRLKDPGLIADEIEMLVKVTHINNVEFTDSIFNVPLTHAKEVLRKLIGKKLNLRLHTMGLTPSAIDEELLDLMKNAGFNEADVGAESLCDKVLESLGKDFNRSDVLKALHLLKLKKMPVTWFIMLGSPAETSDTVHQTLDTIAGNASGLDLVFISTGIRVYNGSPIADEFIRNDRYATDDNFLLPVKIEPHGISLAEIHSIAREYSYRYPNFYFYEKEHIIPGWLLITGNLLLKLFHSRQPVWRLLILKKKIAMIMGIPRIKRIIFNQRNKREDIKKELPGFSLIKTRIK